MPDDRRYTIPDKGSDVGAMKTFLDTFFDYKSPARREWVSEMYLAKMMVESVQWVEREYNQKPGQAVRWTHQPDESVDEIPKPVTNECLPIIDGEIGRMRNRRSKPRVRARKNYDEEAKAGAVRGDEIIESYLDQIAWSRTRRRNIYRMVVFGTGVLKTYLDQDWLDTVKVGIGGAYRCLNGTCSSLVASQDVAPDKVLGLDPSVAARLTRTESPGPGQPAGFQVDACPSCGAPMTPAAPGTPYGISEEEAEGEDVFGAPLGVDVPNNKPMIESVSPFDMYFENEGIGVDPEKLTRVGQQTPRDLEWIASHYNLAYDDVKKSYYKNDEFGQPQYLKPEDPTVIAEQHPIIGEVAYGNMGASSAPNRNLYRNHARVREFYSQPTRRHPRGRTIHMAGNMLLLDDDGMIESQAKPGTYLQRATYHLARYWEKEGQLVGQGALVPLFSPQRRINMTWSQIIATRERCTVNGIIAPRGARLSSAGWMRGFPGHILYYEFDPERPMSEPKPFPVTVMPTEVYEELDKTVDRMQYIVGVQDVDVGKAPQNVSAATAIKLLQDQSSQRREQRNEEMIDAEKGAWSHLILLLREFVREPRPYKFMSQSTGHWEEDVFIGADLEGQTDIIVEEEPSYDDVAYERENVVQGIQMGVISPGTPYSRYAIAKSLGLPSDALEDQNVQIEDAFRRWYAFRDKGTIPSVDQFEDDHSTFWNVYGKEFKSDDGVRMKKECGWDALLKIISGWEQTLQQAQALEPQLQMLRQQIAMGQQTPMIPGIEEKLQEPPLPPALEDKIFYIWTRMVQGTQERMLQAQLQAQGQPMNGQAGLQPPPPAMIPQEPFDINHPFVKMKAVAEAHRKYEEQKTAAAQQAPTAAAPGVAASPAGTELTPNSPQLQGAYGPQGQAVQ